MASEAKLYVITPTGDRPEAFRLCVDYVNRQTRKPDMWIIVDDGRTDAVTALLGAIRVPYQHIRIRPSDGNTVVRNLRAGFSAVPEDAFACVMEDDDWYPPKYLEVMYGSLCRVDYVASHNSRYYSIPTMQYRMLGNEMSFPMHGNGFARSALSSFRTLIRNTDDPSVDNGFSEAYTGSRAFNDEARVIHIVGFGSGRPGTTRWHRMSGDSDGWEHDAAGFMLYGWIGDDIGRYLHRDQVIYVFSNVVYPRDRRIAANPEDILVFLNKAESIEYYGEYRNRIVYHRKPQFDWFGEERLGVQNRYVFDAGELAIPQWFVDRINEAYDWNYKGVPDNDKSPTTGYMVVKYLAHLYPDKEIRLVNFGSAVTNSTYRSPVHNWGYEDSVLSGFPHLYTCHPKQPQ